MNGSRKIVKTRRVQKKKKRKRKNNETFGLMFRFWGGRAGGRAGDGAWADGKDQ